MKLFFSHKSNSSYLTYLPVKLNNISISKCSHQKYLGMILDLKLSFNTHVAQKIKKCSKLIELIKRLSINIPSNALLTI